MNKTKTILFKFIIYVLSIIIFGISLNFFGFIQILGQSLEKILTVTDAIGNVCAMYFIIYLIYKFIILVSYSRSVNKFILYFIKRLHI